MIAALHVTQRDQMAAARDALGAQLARAEDMVKLWVFYNGFTRRIRSRGLRRRMIATWGAILDRLRVAVARCEPLSEREFLYLIRLNECSIGMPLRFLRTTPRGLWLRLVACGYVVAIERGEVGRCLCITPAGVERLKGWVRP
jgi:hypothetical protein